MNDTPSEFENNLVPIGRLSKARATNSNENPGQHGSTESVSREEFKLTPVDVGCGGTADG